MRKFKPFNSVYFAFVGISVLLLAGCVEEKKSPVEQALAKAAAGIICESRTGLKPEEVAVSLESVAQVDSSTLADEIERRRDIFQLKMERQSILESRFLEKKMKVNARRQHIRMEQSAKIIAALDSIAFMRDPQGDSVLYRIYLIEKGKVETIDEIFSLNGYYAVLTPDGKALAFTKDRKALHKGTGRLIPGYEDMLSQMNADLIETEKADSLERERRRRHPYYYWEDEVW